MCSRCWVFSKFREALYKNRSTSMHLRSRLECEEVGCLFSLNIGMMGPKLVCMFPFTKCLYQLFALLRKKAADHTLHIYDTTEATSPVALQLRAPPKVSARAPAHRSYHFRSVKLKSCIKKIHHNLYISKQANVRIKHADTEGASHKKFGTDARVQ